MRRILYQHRFLRFFSMCFLSPEVFFIENTPLLPQKIIGDQLLTNHGFIPIFGRKEKKLPSHFFLNILYIPLFSLLIAETTVLGERVASPICVAPTAMQRMAHNDGECATSKAAARYASHSIFFNCIE